MSNEQKISFAQSQNQFATKKAQEQIQQIGKALPCTVVSVRGAIVRVNFEINSTYTLPQVTCPLAGAEYIRYPIKAGDKGFVIAADANLGQMSGLGGGVADLTTPANLSALVFVPFGNSGWTDADPDAVTIYAPNGVVLRDTFSNALVVVTPTAITLAIGGAAITLTAGNVDINGTLTINGTPYLEHKHGGVTRGSSPTDGVI
jgi:hypothetical protein